MPRGCITVMGDRKDVSSEQRARLVAHTESLKRAREDDDVAAAAPA